MQDRHYHGMFEVLYGNATETTYRIANSLSNPRPVVRLYTDTTPRVEVVDYTVSYPSDHQIEIAFSKPPGQRIYHVHFRSR
jgi:hypothetical protein